MKTVNKNLENIIIRKKSKFQAYVYPLLDVDNLEIILNELKTLHPRASHYCWAYKLKEQSTYSDDGEPSGTAGSRVLDLINLKGLDAILAVVVRYYGGIKLGAGPLSKAYKDVVQEVLTDANISFLFDSYIIDISSSYEKSEELKNKLKEYIINEEYTETVKFRLNIPLELIETLNINYELIDKSYYIKK